MGISFNILNTIRNNASTEYQTRIPEATQDTIASIGNAFSTYTNVYNEFCEALLHKIGKTMIESKLFKNKLATFKAGEVLTKQDVEEIFVNMAGGASAYDPEGKTALARFEPTEADVVYHRENRKDCYAISLGDIDFVAVFRSEATLDSFILAQLNSVYSRAAHDEWVLMKNLLATYDGYADYKTTAIEGENIASAVKDFVKNVRKAKQDMSFASENLNKAGVMTWTDESDIVLFVHKDVLVETDVELLATAFNISKTDIPSRIVVMDDFGSLTDTYGIIADKNFLRVWDTLSRMETQRNAQGLFTNYFYHVHQILSVSPFKNAIRLTTKTSA